MTGAFSVDVLSEKLVKLNTSQQSIETLSHWCIYHRKRAKHIVKTWEKEFFQAPKEKRVSFLYLANDIIQNSRRKGSEFVSEFWKVLNNALKDVKQNGDDNGRNAVSRLVNIWEERKVFGSRAQSLRETLLGNNPVPDFDNQEKVQEKEKDKEKEKPAAASTSIKIKLDGSILEKLAKAFKKVTDNVPNEEATIEECSSTKRRIEALVKEDVSSVSGGENEASTVSDELQQQQGNLTHLVEQLEVNEKARYKLVTQLRDALYEQETKLEEIRTQIQFFRSATEQNYGNHAISSLTTTTVAVKSMASSDAGKRKATAAEIAAKLAASTSSAAVLSSILSSLTAEDSAALGLHSDKRPRLEIPSEAALTSQQYLLPPPVSMLQQQSQFIGLPSFPYSGVPPPPPPPPPPGRPTGLHVSIAQQVPQLIQQQMNIPQVPQLAQQQMNHQQMNSQLTQQMMSTEQMNSQVTQLTQQQMHPHHLNPQQQQISPPLPPGCAPSTYHYYPSAPTQL